MKAMFIVGYWNSGTTLLVDLLRKHPEIWLRRARYKPNLEERTFVKILRRMGGDFIRFDANYATVNREGFVHYREPDFGPEKLATFRRRFGLHFWVPASKTLLLKNPWLFFNPQFLQQVFATDDIRTSIVLRHGAMQVVSKDYWKRSDGDPAEHLIARAHFWVRAMEFFFEHWQPRPDVLVLRYENVCHDPEGQIGQLLAHADLSAEPLLPHLPKLSNRTSKWRELDPALRKQVWDIVAPMQARLDALYPVSDPAFHIEA